MAVLPEYTDEHLTEGASRQDDYGRECRALLRLPAEKRQGVWAAAWRATTHTPMEFRNGMAVSGMIEITGDMTAEIERLVAAGEA
jgi:hypothetical protein